MAKTYCLYSVFLLNIVLVLGKEHRASHPSEEYIEIFRNIPLLFEYLLEVLEERPQILEKNDITVFKRNVDTEALVEECGNRDSKRNADIYECERLLAKISEDKNTSEVFKRDTELSDSNKANHENREIINSTKAHEHVNSVAEYKGKVEKSKSDDTNELNTQNYSNNAHFRTVKNADKTDKKVPRINKVQKPLSGIAQKYVKRQSLLRSNKFSLTPEDVEEQAIKVEQMLEEHNNKEK